MLLKDTLNHFFYTMSVTELQLMNEKFKNLNITYNSLLYLDLIAQTPKCTITQLAQTLHISKSAVTLKVNELVKQGLLIKQQSKQDKRVYYLHLEEEIKDIYTQYDKALYKAMQKVNEQFSIEEQEIFSKILKEIEESYIKEIFNGK